MRKRLVIILAIVMTLAAVPVGSAAAQGVVTLEFEKELVATGVWSGTVETDGSIRTVLTDLRETGNVWHLTFDWFVSDPDFTATVSGIAVLSTGQVSLNGTITQGVYAGASIHIDAQLDPTDLSSMGTMTITP